MSGYIRRIKESSLDLLPGGMLTLAAFALYTRTLAPTVLEGDSGEFQFVAWLPGLAHPTGYPLYTLLGWLWTHLFRSGEVAWRMNLFSAIWAALAIGLTYAVARQLLDMALPHTPASSRTMAAMMAAIILAISPTFWGQAIVAEVYSLHMVFVTAILWLALKHKQLTGEAADRGGKFLSFICGLSLTHHRTIILLFPALLLFLGINQTEIFHLSLANKTKLLMRYGILFTIPLLLYLYLPLIAGTTPYATLTLSDTQHLTLYDNSISGFWQHITAAVFTQALRLTAVGWERLTLMGHLLQQQVGWGGTILAGSGLLTLWQRRQFDLLGLTALGFLAVVAFNLIYFIGDVFVLFIPAWFFLCLWISLGSLTLISRMATLSQKIPQETVIALVLIGLLLGVVLTTPRDGVISQSNNVTAREQWQTILAEPIPPGSILLSNDRDEMMPLWYYQYVGQRRPDLLGLFPLIVPEVAYANVGHVLDQALASGRPVYLIKAMDGLRLKADLSPAGMLFRATANKTPPTYAHQSILPEMVLDFPASPVTETVRLLGYDVSATTVTPGAVLTITLHWQALGKLTIDYTSYVHLLNHAGQRLTQSDHKPGDVFYPSSYWQSGETLRDQHTLTIPSTAAPGLYRLRVGMYYQPQPDVIKSMGAGVEIGQWLIENKARF